MAQLAKQSRMHPKFIRLDGVTGSEEGEDIGMGGFGHIYLGRFQGHSVAIKVMRKSAREENAIEDTWVSVRLKDTCLTA